MVRILLLSVLILNTTICFGQEAVFDIIPLPNKITLENGKFIFGNRINIVPGSAEVQNEVVLLKTFFASHGIRTTVNPPSESQNFIFKKNDQLAEEGYLLKIETNAVQVEYKTSKGAFYALQTFFQLIPPNDENWQGQSIQTCLIEDQPRFPYRGMHLDVCRHFFPPEFIKQYIDLLATYKFNNFHWHLTEDQGWRIEIKKYPKLQEIAAYRKETLIGHYNDVPQKFDGQEYGGYYTQEEVKEIVAYAAQKHINIIPEIEMPGHAQAAVAATLNFPAPAALTM
ncbi:MAG: family 20 glycosylhydrolase [Saprospiraceae bacterium]